MNTNPDQPAASAAVVLQWQCNWWILVAIMYLKSILYSLGRSVPTKTDFLVGTRLSEHNEF